MPNITFILVIAYLDLENGLYRFILTQMINGIYGLLNVYMGDNLFLYLVKHYLKFLIMEDSLTTEYMWLPTYIIVYVDCSPS